MKAHRTDLVSFAFGLMFLGLSAWWLLAQLLGLVLPPVGWFLAGALILVGVLGLVGALRSGRSAGTVTPETVAPAPDVVAPASGQPAGEPAWDIDRPSGGVDPTLWDTDRREWEVSAPTSGEPVPAGGAGRVDRDTADEWPTEAVSDEPVEAVQDRPAGTDRPEASAAEPSSPEPGRGADREAGPDYGPISGPPAGEDRSRG